MLSSSACRAQVGSEQGAALHMCRTTQSQHALGTPAHSQLVWSFQLWQPVSRKGYHGGPRLLHPFQVLQKPNQLTLEAAVEQGRQHRMP